jgi:hypothetical protein
MKINILINALPKSGSLYIVRTIADSLSCERMRIGTRGFNFAQADAEATDRFVQNEKSVAQDHLAPSPYNLDVLYYSGLVQFVVLFRDPRDALVSMAHHLEREDVVSNPWHWCLFVSSGIISKEYYLLNWNEKVEDLINKYFPTMMGWMKQWLQVMETDDRFNIKVMTYEEFNRDKDVFVNNIFRFYGLQDPPIEIAWPADSNRIDKNINLDTHFRKGKIGSYLEELSPEQIKKTNSLSDAKLFHRFGWL